MEEVNEYWAEIPDLKGYYYASNLGKKSNHTRSNDMEFLSRKSSKFA